MQRTSEFFENIAGSLAEKEFAIIPDFLSPALAQGLRQQIIEYRSQDFFKKAGIGKSAQFTIDKEVRGDWIKWVDPAEASPSTHLFIQEVTELMNQLNRLLYLSMKDFECHFAIYPPGTFYEKHLDQFQSTNQRKISMAYYLNPDWQAGDGGEIRMHFTGETIDIPPMMNTLALFRSDTVEHEVLTTHKERFSITGWMRDRPLDFPIFRQNP